MVSNRQISEQLLKYTVENKQALTGNQQMAASLKGVSNAAANARAITSEYDAILGKLGAGASANLTLLEQKLRDRERLEDESLRTNQNITAELRKQVNYVNQRLANAERFRETGVTADLRNSILSGATGASSIGRRGSPVTGALTAVREGLISLPNVGYQNPAVVALRGLIPLADKTGASFGQLGATLGIAGAAVIGVAIAFDRFNQQLEGSKRLLTGALAAQDNYYRALGELTSTQAADQVAELQRLRPILEQEANELRSQLESAFTQASQTPLGDVGARALFNQLPTGALKEELDKAEAALQENIQTEARLTQGREAGVFAANDAEAAEAELAKQRREQANLVLQELASGTSDLVQRAQIQARAQTLTADGRRQEIEALSLQITALSASKAEYDRVVASTQRGTEIYKIYNDASTELGEQIASLTNEQQALIDSSITYADVQAQLRGQIQSQLAVIKDSVAAQQQLFAQIRTATVEQSAERLSAIQEEQAALERVLPELRRLAPESEDAAQALAEAQARLGQLSDEFSLTVIRVIPAALRRAQTELNADLAKLSTESNTKLEAIAEQQREKEADALEKRSKAFEASEEKRGKALNDLAEKQAEQRQRIERKSNAEITNAIFARDALAAYLAMQERAEQLADLKADRESRQKEINAQYKDERAQAQQNYQDALKQAQDAANKARVQEAQRLRQEYDQRQNAYNTQLALLNQFNLDATAQIRAFKDSANAELALLKVPSVNSGTYTASGNTGTSVKGNVTGGSLNSGFTLPANPYIGQTVPDGTGKYWLWNGRAWQPASVQRYAAGGTARGLGMVNDGGGVESGYQRNKLMLFSEPTRIFSAEQTRQIMGGGRGGNNLTINIPIQGSRLTKAQIKDIVDETIDETLPAEWDEAW